MQTLSMGFFLPETNDPSEGAAGIGWFASLAANQQQLNDHDHNGINSKALSSTALAKQTSTVGTVTFPWVDDGGGNWHADVTVPAAISGAVAPLNDINSYSLTFIDTAGNRVNPTVRRLTSTTFRVSYGDNAAVLTALYV